MLGWKIFRYKIVALLWFLIMSILFFLPGSELPQENWLDAVHFDKIVHIALFATLLFLWRSAFDLKIKNYTSILLISAILYGFLVEVIQLCWVQGRSFDLFDVLADAMGSFLGLWIWSWHKKNKPL